MEQLPWLNLMLIAPLLGTIILPFLPRERATTLRYFAQSTLFVTLLLSIGITWMYAWNPGNPAWTESYSWIDFSLNHELTQGATSFQFISNYDLRIDGLSLVLINLTLFISNIALAKANVITKHIKLFLSLFLFTVAALLGVFMARDLIVFFIFFELVLFTVYFLIAKWGFMNREKAASQYLIYNAIGSLLMLVGFILLIATAGFQIKELNADGTFSMYYTTSYDQILATIDNPQSLQYMQMDIGSQYNPFYLGESVQWVIVTLLLVGFAIKLPLVPFHSWMLRVHREGVTPVVILHSSLLLKMGAYGIIRFVYDPFPQHLDTIQPTLAFIGVVTMLYGAILAARQHEFRLVMAYSSISHMGLVMLGIASLNKLGEQGVVIQLVSHGLIAALMFYLLDKIFSETRTNDITLLSGLAKVMPRLSGYLLFAGLASLGLPALSGFVAEYVTFTALYSTHPRLTIVAMGSIIAAAIYVLRAVLSVTYGTMRERNSTYQDLSSREQIPALLLVSAIVAIGIFPKLVTHLLTLTGGFGS